MMKTAVLERIDLLPHEQRLYVAEPDMRDYFWSLDTTVYLMVMQKVSQ